MMDFLVPLFIIALIIVGIYFLTQSKMRVVQEEERLVVYRLGRFHRVAGPGVVLLQRMLDEVKRTFNVRDEPHNVRVNSLFMNGVPFGYTLNFWYRFDLQAAAHGDHERLAKLVQFSDEEREKQVATKVREALVAAGPVIEQRFKPTGSDFVSKLLPIIPGLPSFDAFMVEVRKHLRESLPLVGAILNEEHPLTVTNIHLGSDIIGSFSRGRVATMLRETFPNLPPELLLQAVSSIEGIDMPQQRVVFEGVDQSNTRLDFRTEEGQASTRVRVQPTTPSTAAQPASNPASAAPVGQPSTPVTPSKEQLTKDDLAILKRVPA
ncbi:MAG: hypothetical protein DYG89_17585 [Caldilinea sp. CFX5]|nr:hypothetical protein [Caldilinea sp. CFX5]